MGGLAFSGSQEHPCSLQPIGSNDKYRPLTFSDNSGGSHYDLCKKQSALKASTSITRRHQNAAAGTAGWMHLFEFGDFAFSLLIDYRPKKYTIV